MSLNCPPRLEHFDRSGVIPPSDDPQATQGSTTVFPYNPKRVGFDFQNQGTKPMWLIVMGMSADGNTKFKLAPDEYYYKDQFAPINEIRLIGEAGEPFAASEYGV